MQTMQQYITEMGLEYSQKQFDACLTAFVSEMERGLAGGASSLKMIPAYLDAQAPPSDGGPVIAIDMGGTNLRIALIEWKNSRMHFLDRRQYPMPGTQGNLERSEFFEQIAEYLLPIADADRVQLGRSSEKDGGRRKIQSALLYFSRRFHVLQMPTSAHADSLLRRIAAESTAWTCRGDHPSRREHSDGQRSGGSVGLKFPFLF